MRNPEDQGSPHFTDEAGGPGEVGRVPIGAALGSSSARPDAPGRLLGSQVRAAAERTLRRTTPRMHAVRFRRPWGGRARTFPMKAAEDVAGARRLPGRWLRSCGEREAAGREQRRPRGGGQGPHARKWAGALTAPRDTAHRGGARTRENPGGGRGSLGIEGEGGRLEGGSLGRGG